MATTESAPARIQASSSARLPTRISGSRGWRIAVCGLAILGAGFTFAFPFERSTSRASDRDSRTHEGSTQVELRATTASPGHTDSGDSVITEFADKLERIEYDAFATEHAAAPANAQANRGAIFTTYSAFRPATEYATDVHFNTAGVTLSPRQQSLLQHVLDVCNSRLNARQREFRDRYEQWGRVLIENGMFDDSTNVVAANTIRVGIVEKGIAHAVTIRPGDNAELDLMAVELSAYVAQVEQAIRQVFQ